MRATGIGVIALMLVWGISASAVAASSDTTAKPEWFFHDLVDVDFVMQKIQIPMPEDVMLIDSRPFKPKYVKGHIPMAVSIPDTQFDKMLETLPKNKDALLIFYCGGLKCKLSHKSARKAEALGYTNVKVFAEGFPGYMKVAGNYPSVSVEWVKKQIDGQAEMALYDSRPKRKKYDKGHIPTAISLPDTYFDKETGKLPSDKGKLMVFYCGGFKCKLSHKSAKKALDLGYTNVKVFAAGYPAWKAYAGTGDPASQNVAKIKSGSEEGSIDIEYFKQLVAEDPDNVYLIDVRDSDEFAKGSLKTAVNIPVDSLETKIKTLPADKPIVFICGTGARSGESFYMVQDIRPELKNVYYIDAEMTFKQDGTFTITKPVS
jgi:rhodanese-related sulfurtransferase